jgi:hypothetical protein
MKKIILLFILCFSIGLSAQKNLVINGSFENELQNWRGDVASLSPYDKKSGANSCIINQYVGNDWKSIDQLISIPKNTIALECSAWIKTQDIVQGANKWNVGKLDLEFLTGGEKNIAFESIAMVVGTTPWTFYKKTITIPKGSSKFKIMLALGEATGTILFDDIKIVPITQQELDKIQEEENAKRLPQVISDEKVPAVTVLWNGDFELENSSWRGKMNLSNEIKKEGKSALVISSNTFDWNGIDQIADVPVDATSITISGWLKSENIVQGKEIWNNGLLNVEFTSNGKDKTGDDQSVCFVTGTTDWTYYTKTFTIPKGTQKYRIMVALGFASGTLYADDIKVTF